MALRVLLRYAVALAGVVLITTCIAVVQHRVGVSRLQLSYLLLVLGLAVWAGRGAAVAASLLAFLAFDWFFVRPVGTLLVSDPEEWIALGLFLTVGVTTGTLAAGLKRAAAEASRRTREATTLYELTTTLLAGAQLGPVLMAVVDRLSGLLSLSAAVVRLVGEDEELAVAAVVALSPENEQSACSDVTAGTALVRTPQDVASELSVGLHVVHKPLLLNGVALGVLSAYFSPQNANLSGDTVKLLEAFATQTALAVGRVRLLEEEDRARAAEESDRLRSVFLASISHDLRTPITSIKTAAAFLLSGVDMKTGQDATMSIDREADRLNRLVGDLLEMSRIEAGGARLHRQLEDLAELIGATAQRITPALRGRSLSLDGPSDLPLVPIDGPAIVRVFTNLIENSIKFSPPESAISVTLSRSENSILVRVFNAGAPIPARDRERVFDKFQRLDGGRTDGGTGLGLAICKGIVEEHDGRIWTANEADGVSFYVSLPIHDEVDRLSPKALAG